MVLHLAQVEMRKDLLHVAHLVVPEVWDVVVLVVLEDVVVLVEEVQCH